MTIGKAIMRINTLKPNTYTDHEKIDWLSSLDSMVKRTVIDTHEDGEDVVFNGYDTSTPAETVLLIPEPYDECYINWLESKIDYFNGEYAHYNNSVLRYNEMFRAYANDYNRHHMPKTESINYF